MKLYHSAFQCIWFTPKFNIENTEKTSVNYSHWFLVLANEILPYYILVHMVYTKT